LLAHIQEDMLLRAVRFLDTMIQRDNLQKAAFIKDLGGIWPRVDARVVKFRVLPPLLAEARTEALQPVLLPLLLALLEKQADEVGGAFVPASFSLVHTLRARKWVLLTEEELGHY
jgi:SCY1-like protein 2